MATLSSIGGRLESAARDIAEELLGYSSLVMQDYIDEYYNETPMDFPKKYKRTDKFRLEALQKTGVFKTGNGYRGIIFFEPSSYENQGLDSNTILDWNMHGMHGGHYGGNDVFSSGTSVIDHECRDIAAEVLKRHGIPFK